MDNTQGTPTTFIKSRSSKLRVFLVFVAIVLLVAVAGICVLVIYSYRNTPDRQVDSSGQFDFLLEDEEVTLVNYYNYNAKTCSIPDRVKFGPKDYPVTKIAANAFADHSALVELKIPNSVTKIMGDLENKKGAFSGCVALERVIFSENLTDIGGYAFKNCLSLKSIEIPASVKSVGEGAFKNCLALQSIELNSNSTLSSDSFSNCLQVTALKLGDEVELNDNTRLAFSSLVNLTDIVVTANSNYHYNEVGKCLLATINTENDTLVLGGRDTVIPSSVTTISNWSLSKHVADSLYIPDTVTDIAVNAIDNDVIFTNATSKPVNWATTVPVHCNAQLCTFIANDEDEEESVDVCIYQGESGVVEPAFEQLFPNLEPATPFECWEQDGDTTTYRAKYYSDTITGASDTLEDAITDAEVYMFDADVRMRFKVDFWEAFKSSYYRAKSLSTKVAVTPDFIINNHVTELNEKVSIVQEALNGTNYQDLLESTDWRIGLRNLVAVSDSLSLDDLSAINSDVLINDIKVLTDESKAFLESNSNLEQFPNAAWRDLREKLENLILNVENSSLLGKEILACEKLNRTDYTQASWAELQACLQKARQVTEHNLSISNVRRALENARQNLREEGLEKQLVRLQVWLSVCDDLVAENYQTDAYDQLVIQLILIEEDELVTKDAINTALAGLQASYTNLEREKDVPNYGSKLFNINLIQYFIVTAILFTGAVVVGSISGFLKRRAR